MKTFPMFLALDGRLVVIAGGGEQAAQKARLMAKTTARMRLVAPELIPELAQLVALGRAEHHAGPVAAATFHGATLAFLATGCPGLDASLHGLAKAAGVTVNTVDRPELCDAFTPALVDRDPVVVAIGTEGTAPVLAQMIRRDVETMLEPRLGVFAALSGGMRSAVAARIPRARRRAFWAWAFGAAPRALHAAGREAEAAAALQAAMTDGQAAAPQGRIALVGAGPGARDLLTLRAVQRLQEADVIFYDRLVDPAVLDLARRDAERVFVGKEVGAHDWPQDRICEVIVAAARQGKRVVRLKSGDPGIFGRAAEEIAAAEAAGLPVEIVPGITAAAAAAASLGRPLTERGQTTRLVLATASCHAAAAEVDYGTLLAPGTTLALYMAMHRLREFGAGLVQAGHPPGLEVEIVSRASQADERRLTTTLGAMAQEARRAGLQSPAVVFVRNPAPSMAELAGQGGQVRAAAALPALQ